MSAARTWSFIIILLAAFAPANASGVEPATLELVELCLPNSEACGPVSELCATRLAPDSHARATVRLTSGGEAVPFARLDVEPNGRHAYTDRHGFAHIALPVSTGPSAHTVSAGAATLAFNFQGTAIAIVLEHAPTLALHADGAQIALRALDAYDGQPLEGVVVIVDAGGVFVASDPSDADGRASVFIGYRGQVEETVRIAGASVCGLEATLLPDGPVPLSWASSREAYASPVLTLSVPAEWTSIPLVTYQVTGGEPPLLVEWRLRDLDSPWRSAPIVLPEGRHDVEARVTDARDRTSSTVALVSVDVTPPVLLAQPRSGAACDGLAWRVVEDRSGVFADSVAARANGVAVATQLSQGVVTLSLPAGVHDVELYVADRAGNRAQMDARFVCDIAPPAVTPSWTGTGWVRCEDVHWTAAGAGLVVRLSAAGESVPFAFSNGRVVPALMEGSHSLRLDVEDGVSRLSTTRFDTVRCDAAPPLLALGVRGAMREGHLVEEGGLAVTASDAASGIAAVRARVGDGPWTAPEAVALVGEGSARITVEATDAVGRVTVRSLDVLVDTVAPRLVAPAEAQLPLDLSVRIAEEGSGLARVELRLSDGQVIPVRADADGGALITLAAHVAPGRALLVATDRVGHESAVAITLKTPVATTLPPPEPQRPDEPPENEATLPEPPQAPLAYRLQAALVTPQRALPRDEVRITGIAEGVESGEVRLVDAAGRAHVLDTLDFDGRAFNASGSPPPPGVYTVWILFQTTAGDEVAHQVGTIEVAADAGGVAAAPARTPVGAWVALVSVALVACLMRRPSA